MRAISADERAVLSSAHYNVLTKVWTKDASGVWVELTNLYSYDWFISANWSMQIDQPVMNGRIALRREIGNLSLSPLMSTSPINNMLGYFAPLLNASREILVQTATVSPGADPATAWRSVFEGKIDKVDWKGKQGIITLYVRDMGGYLVDHFIKDEIDYIPDDEEVGTPVETVMQQILDDNGFSNIILNLSTGSPNWNIRSFTQKQEPLLVALRSLAMQIGWVVRYRYQDTGAFELDFFDPQRTKAITDFVLTDEEYIDVTRLDIEDKNIRNFIRIRYYDRDAEEIKEVEVVDQNSINEFGELFMEITEGGTSSIDTEAEATTMAYAALNDLSIPKVSHEIETLYWWPAQIGDLSEWPENSIHYDQNQRYAVVGYTHNISKDKHRTRILVRGRPAGAYENWLVFGPIPNPPKVVIAGAWIPAGKGVFEETYRVFVYGGPYIYPEQAP